jgi:hypothetical protein
MVVRYHWGLGVGHVYSHTRTTSGESAKDMDPRRTLVPAQDTHPASHVEPVTAGQVPSTTEEQPIVHAELESDGDDVDHNLRGVQDDKWEESDDDGQPSNSGYPSDDDEQMAMEEMYGFDSD